MPHRSIVASILASILASVVTASVAVSSLAVVGLTGLVTSSAVGQPEAVREGASGLLLRRAEQRAVDVLARAAQSEDALLRAHAVEGIKPLRDRALPMARLLMDDPNPGVRFVALVTLAHLAEPGVGDAAMSMARGPEADANGSVRAAALVAAKEAGRGVSLTPLARMLDSRDLTERANAVMLLGEFGHRSAIAMIRELSANVPKRTSPVREAIYRLQVAEALAKLGDEESVDAIRAATLSPLHEVQVLGLYLLGELEDGTYAPLLKGRVQDERRSIEVRVAAATSLARLGEDTGATVLLEASRLEQIELNDEMVEASPLRASACFGLGLLPREDTATRLIELLDDPSSRVRVAAAAAIVGALHGP